MLNSSEPDVAIAQFTIANRKGPHFADPLEGWGEALMAKNRSHLALAKFAEAGKYAPNWGRLHLKWGEGLGYAGSGRGEGPVRPRCPTRPHAIGEIRTCGSDAELNL